MREKRPAHLLPRALPVQLLPTRNWRFRVRVHPAIPARVLPVPTTLPRARQRLPVPVCACACARLDLSCAIRSARAYIHDAPRMNPRRPRAVAPGGLPPRACLVPLPSARRTRAICGTGPALRACLLPAPASCPRLPRARVSLVPARVSLVPTPASCPRQPRAGVSLVPTPPSRHSRTCPNTSRTDINTTFAPVYT